VNQRALHHNRYHVAAAWNASDGLALYVDGEMAHHDQLPRRRPVLPDAGIPTSDEFLIGKANDETSVSGARLLAVDEFNFWSEYLNASTIKQLGLTTYQSFYTVQIFVAWRSRV